jgi:hypothetical protein
MRYHGENHIREELKERIDEYFKEMNDSPACTHLSDVRTHTLKPLRPRWNNSTLTLTTSLSEPSACSSAREEINTVNRTSRRRRLWNLRLSSINTSLNIKNSSITSSSGADVWDTDGIARDKSGRLIRGGRGENGLRGRKIPRRIRRVSRRRRRGRYATAHVDRGGRSGSSVKPSDCVQIFRSRRRTHTARARSIGEM